MLSALYPPFTSPLAQLRPLSYIGTFDESSFFLDECQSWLGWAYAPRSIFNGKLMKIYSNIAQKEINKVLINVLHAAVFKASVIPVSLFLHFYNPLCLYYFSVDRHFQDIKPFRQSTYIHLHTVITVYILGLDSSFNSLSQCII